MSLFHQKCCTPVTPYVGYLYYYTYDSSNAWCHACNHPVHHCSCHHAASPFKIPCELSEAGEALIGGLTDVTFTLEYRKTGDSPKIAIVMQEENATTTWEVNGITEGYHVKEHFAMASPGALVKIKFSDCTVHLRWCETICC